MATAEEATRHTEGKTPHIEDKLTSIVGRDPQTPAWNPESAWPDDRVGRIFRDMARDVLGGSKLEIFGDETEAAPLHPEEFVADGTFVIRVEMPGVDPDKDVQLTVRDDATPQRRAKSPVTTVEAGPVRAHLERERRELIQIVTRLHDRFSSLPIEQVERAVFHRYSELAHSRIRDFLPILVERLAREDLRRADTAQAERQTDAVLRI